MQYFAVVVLDKELTVYDVEFPRSAHGAVDTFDPKLKLMIVNSTREQQVHRRTHHRTREVTFITHTCADGRVSGVCELLPRGYLS